MPTNLVENSGATKRTSTVKAIFEFDLAFAISDWFAVGFSNNGSLSDADVCVFWTDWRGLQSLTDASTDGEGRVRIDEHNDCGDFKFAMMRGGG